MNVGEQRRKLSQWAEQDKERTFYGLLKLISQAEWLRLAHDHVARNQGSACGRVRRDHHEAVR